MDYKNQYKRALDITLSLVAMPVVGAVIVGTSVLIKLDDKGAVFFKSYRLGKNKSKFLMYKFRSMKMNAPDIRNEDGSTYNSENDSRITRVGKFIRKTSIDEIPQLINVIKGDMSLVGPRPDTPEALNIYKNDEARKLEVKPGITGYNQAFFRNSIPQEYKFKNDVYYVDHVSFKFDFIIIWKTILSVLKRSNINNKER
ncbi:sugar transferase [Staphylococcus sp. NRL 16/872]|uniref:sugar transferase n=1 Tax=Staphylococcus sp. NRL 16/872 TaxID=2930131 RepID=UPI001FB465EC|nr:MULTISPECIES: sugar transferase [unclassified Staphylococcus]MCJ1655440.1 sugar transferase [Staphylococcus sp. NRL 21/187]MCJ1661275.1 sugar transferase [Staphylococcus sp. NRL 18/288]MCJ1667162.1 sugar transferase [Staphylococcus sp. NRL 19/737]WEN69645.1 sugar transferase [Staphylococcus sp. NRL 16/872]